MKGLFIDNEYLQGEKYSVIYREFGKSFARSGVEIDKTSNAKAWELVNANRLYKYDFVLFWDKDLLLNERLANLGYKVFNSAKAIALCDDKGATYNALYGKIKMPKTIIAPFTYENIGYTDYDFLTAAERELGYPMVVKESRGSFGKQVYLVNDREKLLSTAKRIGVKPFIMQEFISSSYGVDVRAQVVGDKVVAAVKRKGAEGSFVSNASSGGKMEKFDIPAEFVDLAIKSAKGVGADFAGVDVLFGKNDEPILCEINSNAHFKNLFDATGVNTADYIAEYVLGKIK